MVHFNPIRVAHFIPLKVVHLFPIQVAHLFRYYHIIDHPGYAGDMILPFKMNHDDIHQEISDEEKKLCRLTDEFYNARIRELECCQSDAEVIHAFKDNAEIQRELVTYLKDNGVSSEMITVFVENLFTWLFHD